MWREYRCQQPATSHKPGMCGGILLRVAPSAQVGRVEVKCHRCHRVQVIEVREYQMALST